MKILFGIQGTGNGHISRGRMLAKYFARQNVDVQYLFSGRPADKYFDMEIFGNYLNYRGLTFYSKNGRVSYLKTALHNNIFAFLNEVRQLDIQSYDLIITDFEPITAWAAKLSGIKSIGIGHQYAFGHDIPRAGENPIAGLTMKLFAPSTEPIGLHWDHFGNIILPPIIDNSLTRRRDPKYPNNKIVVYLPFENQLFVQSLFADIKNYQFYIYSPDLEDSDLSHLHLRKTSHEGFKRDLTSAAAVICNSGFELISECLHLGLQILTKPQAGQMEQQSNAAALDQLGYAKTVTKLNADIVRKWLDDRSEREPIIYPDVAGTLVQWLADGQQTPLKNLCEKLWRSTRFNEQPETDARMSN